MYRSNLTINGNTAVSTSHEDKTDAVNIDMITDSKYQPFLKHFRRIRQNEFVQDDGERGSSPFCERGVTVIRGCVSKGVYDLLKDLKEEAEGMIHTRFNGNMDSAFGWICEEFYRRLAANPSLLQASTVYRSVLATLPIVTKTLRGDYKSALEEAEEQHGIEWVKDHLFDLLGEDIATFYCRNRHHVNGALVDSRSESLLNSVFGNHIRLHSALASKGIEALSEDEALMGIGQCDQGGVAIFKENMTTVHFSEEFRESIGVSPDPRETFILHLHGGDLFRDSIANIVDMHGFTVESY